MATLPWINHSWSIIEPAEAYYHQEMGEFILTYADVQKADNPDQKLLAFLDSTYAVGAELAKWDPDLLKPQNKNALLDH